MIEVIVVIVIIAIVAGLILAGVLMAREDSRRLGCSNNLRQLGIAINSYAAETGVMPLSSHFSFHSRILPYLDQVPLYNSINFNVDTTIPTPANLTVHFTQLAVFLCPDDNPPNLQGWTSYAGNRGVGVQTYGYNGAFENPFEGLPVGLAQFTDGLSTTAAVTEWVLGNGKINIKDRARSIFNTPEPLLGSNQLNLFASVCHGLDIREARLNDPGKGQNWLRGEFARTLYNHTLVFNDLSCANGGYVQQGAWTAGSLHSNGAHTLFVDGHVHFNRDGMDWSVWRALGSRNGGEIVSEESF